MDDQPSAPRTDGLPLTARGEDDGTVVGSAAWPSIELVSQLQHAADACGGSA